MWVPNLCGHNSAPEQLLSMYRMQVERKTQWAACDSNRLSVLLIETCGSPAPHAADYTTLTQCRGFILSNTMTKIMRFLLLYDVISPAQSNVMCP